jgi:hypothetical protein
MNILDILFLIACGAVLAGFVLLVVRKILGKSNKNIRFED